jgi:L-threonylcarbamoyladenylate synthase
MLDQNQIVEASKIIQSGGVVAFPTETVYGLGANALNPAAVAKIFSYKERPSFDPLIVHIASVEDIEPLISVSDNRLYMLAEKFWPGPLTIVLPKSDIVPDIVTSGLATVGIRVPDNEIALELIRLSGCPISAPSANKFGRISPTSAKHVRKQLPQVDCILDGGTTKVGIESTVITLDKDGFVILREGFITSEDLESVIPKSKNSSTKYALSSPGLMKSHYSPQKPIFIESELTQKGALFLKNNKLINGAYISFSGKTPPEFSKIEYLSRSSDLKEAAVNLFGILHRLEESPEIEFIVSESVPEQGIGLAIMDRLRKAAYRYS